MRHSTSIACLAIVCTTLAACGSDDGSPTEGSAGGGQDAGAVEHLVGESAAKYSEVDETGNTERDGAEDTGYTLDETGIAISGQFEASPTRDLFKFKTGTFGRMDVRVYVDGKRQDEMSSQTGVTLDAVVNDGYSTLSGNGYFINAWIQPEFDYLVGISAGAGAAGKKYVIEMKGNPE